MNIIPIPGFSEPFSSISHYFGCLLALIGMIVLMRKGRGNIGRQFALLVFSFGLLFQFSMSGTYHLLEPGGMPRYVLRVLDHAAIFVLIAGSFTPIHIILFRGVMRWGILGIVWLLAINGIVFTSIFLEQMPEWLTLSFFIGLGWIGVITFWNVKNTYADRREDMFFIILGGLAYTIGAVLEFLRWPVLVEGVIGPHEIFHVFVIIGAFAHWKFIYGFANSPITEEFVIHVIESTEGFFAYSDHENIEFTTRTLEELHTKITIWVEENYHDSMKPNKINLRYSREERLL